MSFVIEAAKVVKQSAKGHQNEAIQKPRHWEGLRSRVIDDPAGL